MRSSYLSPLAIPQQSAQYQHATTFDKVRLIDVLKDRDPLAWRVMYRVDNRRSVHLIAVLLSPQLPFHQRLALVESALSRLIAYDLVDRRMKMPVRPASPWPTSRATPPDPISLARYRRQHRAPRPSVAQHLQVARAWFALRWRDLKTLVRGRRPTPRQFEAAYRVPARPLFPAEVQSNHLHPVRLKHKNVAARLKTMASGLAERQKAA